MSVITKQSDNSLIPDAPEYGKGWKAEFNHGCCSFCNNKTPPPVCVTKTQTFTRFSQAESLTSTVSNRYCPCQNQAPVSGCEPCNKPVDA